MPRSDVAEAGTDSVLALEKTARAALRETNCTSTVAGAEPAGSEASKSAGKRKDPPETEAATVRAEREELRERALTRTELGAVSTVGLCPATAEYKAKEEAMRALERSCALTINDADRATRRREEDATGHRRRRVTPVITPDTHTHTHAQYTSHQ